MKKPTTLLWIALVIVITGFSVGIYLQDLKHQESTEAAWKANRFNMERFYKIRQFTGQINDANWRDLRDSIGQQLDSFMILRYRKEMDSLNAERLSVNRFKN
tara:strand:+ start:283 stop:588 length:306 start_codon:yes stop_codon:yes gene_type:complete